MQILVNGESKTIATGLNVQQLLQQLGVAEQKLAVEINQEIIPRSRLSERQLFAGDRVEIIHAIGGG